MKWIYFNEFINDRIYTHHKYLIVKINIKTGKRKYSVFSDGLWNHLRFWSLHFRNSLLTMPKITLNQSLLTFRSRHNTSLVLQLDIFSRASLRDNFLNIAPRVHASVTKKRRTCSPSGRICICFLWARYLDSPCCFVFSSLIPPYNVQWRLSYTLVWRTIHRHSDWPLSFNAPVLSDTI